jgi:hypothetical protein
MVVGGHLHVPAALPPGERPGTYYTEGWVVPRAGLDRAENCHRNSITGPLSSWRIAVPTELSRPTVLLYKFYECFYLDSSTAQLTQPRSNYCKNNQLLEGESFLSTDRS